MTRRVPPGGENAPPLLPRGADRENIPFREQWYWIVPIVYAGILGIDAIAHGYFDVDDFHNIYWARSASAWRTLLSVFLPWRTTFRPAGIFLYRAVSGVAGLDPVPYHVVLLALNLANVALVYRVARRAAGERTGAFAASLFLLPATLITTFWRFGEIFEILSTGFFLLAFWAFLSLAGGWRKTVAIALLFVVACHAKEMAITLPIVLVAYDVFLGEGRIRRHALIHATLLALAIAIAFGFREEDISSPRAAYYLDVRPGALLENGAWYARAFLSSPAMPGAALALLAVAVLAITLALRDRLLSFAAFFVPATFLPVIFLTNHRFGFYWYAPSFGAWLWLGRLAEIWAVRFRGPGLRRAAAPALYVGCLLAALAGGEKSRARGIAWQRAEAARVRAEVEKISRPCPAGTARVGKDFFSGESASSTSVIYRVICGDLDLAVRRD